MNMAEAISRGVEAPKRIQLRRAKGWRMPENAVKVDRSTKWGNPFTVKAALEAGYSGTDSELRGMCVDAFRRWLDGEYPIEPERRTYILNHIDQLKGHDLACWCPLDHPCHAEVLIKLANAPEASDA